MGSPGDVDLGAIVSRAAFRKPPLSVIASAPFERSPKTSTIMSQMTGVPPIITLETKVRDINTLSKNQAVKQLNLPTAVALLPNVPMEESNPDAQDLVASRRNGAMDITEIKKPTVEKKEKKKRKKGGGIMALFD